MNFPDAAAQTQFPFRALLSSHFSIVVFAALLLISTGGEQAAYANGRPMARLVTATPPSSSKAVREATSKAAPKARLVTAAPVKLAPTTIAVLPPAAPLAVTSDEQRAFDLVNARRVGNGVKPLVWDEQIFHIARLHSESMAQQGLLAHTSTDGSDAVGRARHAGIEGWSALGENIAYNQGFDDPSQFAVERWMNSVKHRANILRAEFTHAALGVREAPDGRVFLTQVFVTR